MKSRIASPALGVVLLAIAAAALAQVVPVLHRSTVVTDDVAYSLYSDNTIKVTSRAGVSPFDPGEFPVGKQFTKIVSMSLSKNGKGEPTLLWLGVQGSLHARTGGTAYVSTLLTKQSVALSVFPRQAFFAHDISPTTGDIYV